MSWLARSLVNSLKSEEEEEEGEEKEIPTKKSKQPQTQDFAKNPGGEELSDEQSAAARGVKEDLSELTKTLTRQFWGVASFLAPPPPPPPPPATSSDDSISGPDSPSFAGIRSDFAEIGGRFKTGISKLSSHKAVSEISKIASSFLPFGGDDDRSDENYASGSDGAVGVTDEVLAFARNISMHPETWLDFPLFIDDDDSDDFDMSDAQQEHALAVERLEPRLAALRIELCPSHMSEGCFWKIYFVLLHSRLSKHDAELLSTPQIVEARALWLQELQKRTKPEAVTKEPIYCSNEEQLAPISSVVSETKLVSSSGNELVRTIPIEDVETDKHPVISTEVKIIDKSVVEEPVIETTDKDLSVGTSKILDHKFVEEGDDWLDEENAENDSTTIPLGNEEDVSFSDLEDDEDRSVRTSSKTVTDASDSSLKDSRGWVQLSRSHGESTADSSPGHHQAETKESGDWLNLEDLDTD